MKYFNLKRKPSDINEHLETLSSYTEGCTKVFENGVRGVVSSWALLHGLNTNKVDGKKFVMNDIDNVNVDSISLLKFLLILKQCLFKEIILI